MPTPTDAPTLTPIALDGQATVLGTHLEAALYELGHRATEAARTVRLGQEIDYTAACERLHELARTAYLYGAQLAVLDELRYGRLKGPSLVRGEGA